MNTQQVEKHYLELSHRGEFFRPEGQRGTWVDKNAAGQFQITPLLFDQEIQPVVARPIRYKKTGKRDIWAVRLKNNSRYNVSLSDQILNFCLRTLTFSIDFCLFNIEFFCIFRVQTLKFCRDFTKQIPTSFHFSMDIETRINDSIQFLLYSEYKPLQNYELLFALLRFVILLYCTFIIRLLFILIERIFDDSD